jgi:hypothetical protein
MDEATVLVALDKEVAKGKANGERLKKEFTWQRDYGGENGTKSRKMRYPRSVKLGLLEWW